MAERKERASGVSVLPSHTCQWPSDSALHLRLLVPLYLPFSLLRFFCHRSAAVCQTVGCVKVKKKEPKTTHRDLHFTPSFCSAQFTPPCGEVAAAAATVEPACQCERSAALHAAYLSSLASEGVTLARADFVAMQTQLISLASSRRHGSLPHLGARHLQSHLLDGEVTNAVAVGIALALLAHRKDTLIKIVNKC